MGWPCRLPSLANFHITRLMNDSRKSATLPTIDRNLYYRALVAVTDVKREKLFGPSFCESIEAYDALRPSSVGKSQKAFNSVLADLSIVMATMATNHLWSNASHRLKRYLGWRYPHLRKDHSKIARAVLDQPTVEVTELGLRHEGSVALVAELRRLVPLPSGQKFANRAHLTLPLYALILRESEAAIRGDRTRKRARTFTLLPLKRSFTISHVPVSKMTLMTLLKAHGMEDFKGDGRDEDQLAYWGKYFNLNAFETRNRRFVGTAVTDGVSVSMLLDRKTSPSGPCLSRSPPSFDSLAPGTVIAGVDPGFSDLVTVSRASVTEQEDGRKVVGAPAASSYSSAKYYAISKISLSRRKAVQWNKETEEAVKRLVSPRTVDMEVAKESARAFLAELPGLLAHRARRAYRGMRFTRYVHRQKALDDICRFLAPDPGSVVAFGDWSGGYKSPVSRRCAGPIADIKRRLASTPDVRLVVVDEFRTSVTCNRCRGRLTNMRARSRVRARDGGWRETFGRVHKVLHCRNSDGASGCQGAWTWNRDVNASRNILVLVEHEMRGQARPAPFARLSSTC